MKRDQNCIYLMSTDILVCSGIVCRIIYTTNMINPMINDILNPKQIAIDALGRCRYCLRLAIDKRTISFMVDDFPKADFQPKYN